MNHDRICCAVDFSRPSALALAEATELARRLMAELVIVHVHPRAPRVAADLLGPAQGSLEEEARYVEAELARCRTSAEAGTTTAVKTVTLVGDPADELVRYAKEEGVDLLVLGTHGRTGVSRAVLGSVAEKVVRHASCPVLVVRPTPRAEERDTQREAEQYTA
ncbi:MAG TPA: universal stress protein [Anaeromyxobacteraceae bacterium]|nr:universal stress protein [Anaeromyxobacteraceae bacterium]